MDISTHNEESDMHHPLRGIGIVSRGIGKIPHLSSFLEGDIVWCRGRVKQKITAVAGWGVKATAERARHFATRNNVPYLALEDGFLRSFGLGVNKVPPLSIVVDDVGIYYDASRPSLLENILNTSGWESDNLITNAQRAISLILEHGLSKYNHAPDAPVSLFKNTERPKVLVVDQTQGDMSVVLGLADKSSFDRVYEAARHENPDAEIYIKTHPDVIAGKKKGYLTDIKKDENTVIIREDINPPSLIRNMDRVYVVSSHLGFEALLLNKPVTCFGMPFYAGWGVTDDRVLCPRRVRKRTVLEIFAAAYLKYARYIDPVTGRRGGIFDVIEHIVRQKRFAGQDAENLYCFGFSLWKRENVRPFLKSPQNRVIFVRNARQARNNGIEKNSRIVVWGHNESEEVKELASSLGISIWRLEDGFIRSVGLGSDLIRPFSLVMDRRGIYYDPGRESDLEWVLNTYEFTPAILERAALLRRLIVDNKITKYNTEANIPLSIRPKPSQKVIFVPGQVEDDASITMGAGGIKTNENLLRHVRLINPDAFVIYKPHPDVLAKNRKGKVSLSIIQELCNHLETRASVISCIETADEIHTLTSLTGFDAILRGKKVVTYGIPFYAGWGLTKDSVCIPRRTRKLTLAELIAGVLLIYPRYWDWESRGFVECETIVTRIMQRRTEIETKGQLHILQPRYMTRQARKISFLLKGWLHR